MDKGINVVQLCGNPAGRPEYSHEGRDGVYYTFPLSVERLSGTRDILNIVAKKELIEELEIGPEGRMRVTGEVRSFNNRSGRGSRLVITVLAKKLEFTDDEHENKVELAGALCKATNLRRTPMGREICDMMLAVNRRYSRSDYLPCIAWGSLAKEAAQWGVGTQLKLTGRLQSRNYIKNEGDCAVEKTAFEVSVVTMERLEKEE